MTLCYGLITIPSINEQSNCHKIMSTELTLEQKFTMQVKNPFLKLHADAFVNGRMKLHSGKRFKKVGVTTNLDYEVNDGRWIASVNKQLSQRVKARLSAIKEGAPSFYDKETDKTMQLIYQRPF